LLEVHEAADWADLLANRFNVLYDNVLWYAALRAMAALAGCIKIKERFVWQNLLGCVSRWVSIRRFASLNVYSTGARSAKFCHQRRFSRIYGENRALSKCLDVSMHC